MKHVVITQNWILAIIPLTWQHKKGLLIHLLFLKMEKLLKFLQWYRQLKGVLKSY